MTRRAPLPMITECVEKQAQSKGGVSRVRLLRAAYPFFVICVLSLAHVHLEFARVDLLIQQGQLQGQRSVLYRQEQMLMRQNEAMCDLESLKLRARRDLNMQEIENHTKDLYAAVPADIQAKYAEPLNVTESDKMLAQLRAERQQQGLQHVLLSLFDGGQAVAAEPRY